MVLAVVDASVVAKWFLEEEATLEARKLRDDFFEGLVQLRAPAILPFEVLNALRYHPRFPDRHLVEASRALDRAAILTVPLTGDFLERTVGIARDRELSIYDASYLALAALADCPLYTADEALLETASAEESVVAIREYGR
jgi:predicted nucleic acid-binding protein